MDIAAEKTAIETSAPAESGFDYSFVPNTARIAIYDDLLSSPQIEDIEPTTTREFINNLATSIYDHAKKQGGSLPYSIILQVTENFIHAKFAEVVVSIMDDGNTIRFTDQGPGISNKEKAQQPGYSSANAQMKKYIHGVGSGLPIVREYLETKHGNIRIEDNMNTGAVVTISLADQTEPSGSSAASAGSNPSYSNAQDSISQEDASLNNTGALPYPEQSDPINAPQQNPASQTAPVPQFSLNHLSKDEIKILKLFLVDDVWGVKNIAAETDIPISTAHNKLNKLLEAGIMSRLGTKWILSDFGNQVVNKLK